MEQRRGAAGWNSPATSTVDQKLHSHQHPFSNSGGRKKLGETGGQSMLWPYKSQTVDWMEGSDGNGKWLHSLRPAVFDRQSFMVRWRWSNGCNTLIYSSCKTDRKQKSNLLWSILFLENCYRFALRSCCMEVFGVDGGLGGLVYSLRYITPNYLLSCFRIEMRYFTVPHFNL